MDPPIPWNPCRYNRSLIVNGTDGAFLFLFFCHGPETPPFVASCAILCPAEFLFNGTTGGAPDEQQLAAFITHNGPASVGINAQVFHLMDPNCGATSSCFVTTELCAQVRYGLKENDRLVPTLLCVLAGRWRASQSTTRQCLLDTAQTQNLVITGL
jgi:hypothetical protein